MCDYFNRRLSIQTAGSTSIYTKQQQQQQILLSQATANVQWTPERALRHITTHSAEEVRERMSELVVEIWARDRLALAAARLALFSSFLRANLQRKSPQFYHFHIFIQ